MTRTPGTFDEGTDDIDRGHDKDRVCSSETGTDRRKESLGILPRRRKWKDGGRGRGEVT